MAWDMLCSCFDLDEDHKCIKVTMAKNPTIAIFMSPKDGQDKKKRMHPKQELAGKSILDVKDPSSSLQCLAAVNYHSIGRNTMVLWLATTIKAPPVDSINVKW